MDAGVQPMAVLDQAPDPAELNLCPVLFGGYRELTGLRYYFPLVLVDGAGAGAYVRSLSGIVNGILTEIAPASIEVEVARATATATRLMRWYFISQKPDLDFMLCGRCE